MKILLVGDTHGIEYLSREGHHMVHGWDSREPFWTYWFEKALDKGCTAIFQLGDFGFWEHFESGVAYVDTVGRLAEQYGIPVYCLDGNHDKTSLVESMYPEKDAEGFLKVRDAVRYAPRGHRWTWNGRNFMAVGGAFSVDKGWRLDSEMKRARKLDKENHFRELAGHDIEPFEPHGILWFPEEELLDMEVQEILDASEEPLDVLLTHDKPRASNPTWNRKDIPECYPNQDRIQRIVTKFTPHLLVHGHLHYRYTDIIRCGNDGYRTQVEGITCDPNAGAFEPEYDIEDSYLVLDVEPKGLATT